MAPTPDDELLKRVLTEGTRRRRRRAALLGTGSGAAVLAVALLAASLAGPDRADLAVGVDDTTTTSWEPSTSASTTLGTLPPSTPTTPLVDVLPPPTDTAPPATAAPSPPTTEPPLVCRNSYDPRCGDFVYVVPAAPNQPIAYTATLERERVPVGEPVVVRIVAADPDASLPEPTSGVAHNSCGGPTALWFQHLGRTKCSISCPQTQHGPWDPPAPEPAPASIDADLSWTYDTPGTYSVLIQLQSGRPISCIHDPYTSSASTTLTFEVVAAGG